MRVAVNTAVSGARTLIRLAVGFALLPILLDGIGAARTGLFLFATTLTGYFTAVDVGVGSSVTRYVAEHRARAQPEALAATVRASLLAMLGFGVLAAVALAIFALSAARPLFGGASTRSVAGPTILVAAATALVYWPSRVGVAALNGIERYDRSAWIQIGSSAVLLAALGVLAHQHVSVVALSAVFGAVTVSEGLLSAALAWRELGVERSWLRGRWWGGEQLRGVLRFGTAAFLIGVGDTVINSFDRAIVGAVVGAAAIVAYDIAQRPQSAIQTIAGISGLALVSPVARLAALGEHRRMRELVLIASFVSIAVTAPIAVLVIVLSHPFVAAWLGARYVHDAAYIDVFVSYWVVNCATAAISSALYGLGRLETYARIVVAMAIVSLPLSIGLTFAFGTIGVIWGTVIPAVVAIPVFTGRSLRLLEIPWGAFARRVLLPGFGTVGAWSAAVLAAKLLVEPRGYGGLIAFSAVALAICWAALAPPVLARVRAARRPPVAARVRAARRPPV